jgi:hypothetical protein
MTGDFVVAITQDDKGVRLRNAAAQILDEIERRLIGPMDILDDEQRRPPRITQKIEQGGEQSQPRRVTFELRQEPSAGRARNVIEGSERGGREERVALAQENAVRPAGARKEVSDEGRLADARLAADQNEAALTGRRLGERRCQKGEFRIAFKQCHGPGALPRYSSADQSSARPAASTQMRRERAVISGIRCENRNYCALNQGIFRQMPNLLLQALAAPPALTAGDVRGRKGASVACCS